MSLTTSTTVVEWLEQTRPSSPRILHLPELPDARRARFEEEYGLSPADARLLTETRAEADAFEEAVRLAVAGRHNVVNALGAANARLHSTTLANGTPCVVTATDAAVTGVASAEYLPGVRLVRPGGAAVPAGDRFSHFVQDFLHRVPREDGVAALQGAGVLEDGLWRLGVAMGPPPPLVVPSAIATANEHTASRPPAASMALGLNSGKRCASTPPIPTAARSRCSASPYRRRHAKRGMPCRTSDRIQCGDDIA